MHFRKLLLLSLLLLAMVMVSAAQSNPVIMVQKGG
jgi:hypothetical protein